MPQLLHIEYCHGLVTILSVSANVHQVSEHYQIIDGKQVSL